MLDRRTLFGAAALMGLAAAAPEEAATAAPIEGDWPWLGRYADENRRLQAEKTNVGIVFMGDSITEGWLRERPGFFTPGRVDRGISGQTTPQMLLRTMADVVALRPRFMHLMAGTNDIAGNTGPMTAEQTQANLTAMIQLARANGIKVLLATVPPAAAFPWRPGLETVEPIRRINEWIRSHARDLGATLVDYTPALDDGRGGIGPALAGDGVHPTGAGYDAMAAVVEPILRRSGV